MGLAIHKHMHNLSDEELFASWVENPYCQLFRSEVFFQLKPTFDRLSLTRRRQRMGEEKLVALIQESLSGLTRTGASKLSDFAKVCVDTTVQPKAVALPTDAKLMHRARERLVKLAKNPASSANRTSEWQERARRPSALRPRQAVQAGQSGAEDDPHYLGRVTRNIVRKINSEPDWRASSPTRACWRPVREQRQNQRGRKVYSLSPEVECIGKSLPWGLTRRARRPRRHGNRCAKPYFDTPKPTGAVHTNEKPSRSTGISCKSQYSPVGRARRKAARSRYFTNDASAEDRPRPARRSEDETDHFSPRR